VIALFYFVAQIGILMKNEHKVQQSFVPKQTGVKIPTLCKPLL
jgi:hypothetical protein